MNLPVTIYNDVLDNSSNRVFIFSEARSGSNWLLETLNSGNEVALLREIMQPEQRNEFTSLYPGYPDKGNSDVLYIERQLSVVDFKLKGCKILYPQAVRFMDLYEFLFNYRDAKFILLRRENSLKGEVSGFISREFSFWHPQERQPKHMVTIDPELLYKRVLWRQLSTSFCTNLIKAQCLNFKELTYEELFSNTRHVLDSLCAFLSISSEKLSPAQEVKSNPHSLAEIIVNYEEVKSCFINNGYHSMLV